MSVYSVTTKPHAANAKNTFQRRSKINIPASTANTANTVVNVGDIRTLVSGKSPVRINQIPSSNIPRFLPAKLVVSAIGPS